jgi:hypothetical protein
MDVAVVHRVVDELAGFDPAERDRARLAGLNAALRRLRSWCEGREVAIAAAMRAVASFPEQALADSGRCSTRDAARTVDRSKTAEKVPSFGAALDRGDVSAAHVDALTRALGSVEADLRDELAARLDALVDVATQATPDELARRARAEADRLRREDGMSRLERQRRDARVRTWVDRATGMWCISGRFDPATGVALEARLAAQLDAVRARGILDHAPDDPLERQGFLRAAALAELLTGRGVPARPAEVVVVVDTTWVDADGRPRLDWGLPVELPPQVVADLLAAGAKVRPVVLHEGEVVSAPGAMDLGHTTPLASRDQRRVLRARYPTCVVGGCDVPFDRCEIHHVTWRRHGGPTNLANLRPVCIRHHHHIHDHGWQLTTHPDGTNTTTLPDGTTLHSQPATRSRRADGSDPAHHPPDAHPPRHPSDHRCDHPPGHPGDVGRRGPP